MATKLNKKRTRVPQGSAVESVDFDALSESEIAKLKKRLDKIENERAETEIQQKVPGQILQTLFDNYAGIRSTSFGREIQLSLPCTIFVAMKEDMVYMTWEFPELVLEDRINEYYIFKQYPELKEKFKEAKKFWDYFKDFVQDTAKAYHVNPDHLWKKIIKESNKKCGA